MTNSIQWDVSEVVALGRGWDAALGRVPQIVQDQLLKAGDKVADRARTLAPKQTGHMADSIEANLLRQNYGADVAVEVGPTAYYGRYVEHGTSMMPPRPFLGPAADQEATAIADAVADAIAEVFGA